MYTYVPLDPPVSTRKAQSLNGGIGVFAHRPGLVDVARKLAFDDANLNDSAFVVRACTWAVIVQFKRDWAFAFKLISTLISLTCVTVV